MCNSPKELTAWNQVLAQDLQQHPLLAWSAACRAWAFPSPGWPWPQVVVASVDQHDPQAWGEGNTPLWLLESRAGCRQGSSAQGDVLSLGWVSCLPLPTRHLKAERACFGFIHPVLGCSMECLWEGLVGQICPAKKVRGHFLHPQLSDGVW